LEGHGGSLVAGLWWLIGFAMLWLIGIGFGGLLVVGIVVAHWLWDGGGSLVEGHGNGFWWLTGYEILCSLVDGCSRSLVIELLWRIGCGREIVLAHLVVGIVVLWKRDLVAHWLLDCGGSFYCGLL
jgi:hypothetical protein